MNLPNHKEDSTGLTTNQPTKELGKGREGLSVFSFCFFVCLFDAQSVHSLFILRIMLAFFFFFYCATPMKGRFSLFSCFSYSGLHAEAVADE